MAQKNKVIRADNPKSSDCFFNHHFSIPKDLKC